MTDEKEFHNKRMMFYIDDASIIKFCTNAKYKDSTHAKWFSDMNIPYLHTVRGYYVEGEDHITIYVNDFEIPDLNIKMCGYLFEYFPEIKWIGIGCHKDIVGSVWEPKLKVYKN